ncbi:hypothetical protein pb186bvf_015262 [Paramecium bursaria]
MFSQQFIIFIILFLISRQNDLLKTIVFIRFQFSNAYGIYLLVKFFHNLFYKMHNLNQFALFQYQQDNQLTLIYFYIQVLFFILDEIMNIKNNKKFGMRQQALVVQGIAKINQIIIIMSLFYYFIVRKSSYDALIKSNDAKMSLILTNVKKLIEQAFLQANLTLNKALYLKKINQSYQLTPQLQKWNNTGVILAYMQTGSCDQVNLTSNYYHKYSNLLYQIDSYLLSFQQEQLQSMQIIFRIQLPHITTAVSKITLHTHFIVENRPYYKRIIGNPFFNPNLLYYHLSQLKQYMMNKKKKIQLKITQQKQQQNQMYFINKFKISENQYKLFRNNSLNPNRSKMINQDIKQTIQNYDMLLKEYQNLKFYCDSIDSEQNKYFQQHKNFYQQFQPEFFKNINDYLEGIINDCQLDVAKVQKSFKKQIDRYMVVEDQQQQEIENYKKNCKELEQMVKANEITIKLLKDDITQNEQEMRAAITQNEENMKALKEQHQFEKQEMKKKIKILDDQLQEYQKELANEKIKYDELKKENQENLDKYIQTEQSLTNLRDQKNTLLQDALKEKQVIYFEGLILKNSYENYEQQIQHKIEEINDLKQKNQHLIQEIMRLKLLFFNKQIELENDYSDRMLQTQNQLTDKQNQLAEVKFQLEQKHVEIAFSIQSIKKLEDNFKNEEKISYEEKQILKQNINFILKKINPNQKVQQITPLITLLQQLTIDLQNNQSIDPFSNQQIMTQEGQFSQLELQYELFGNIVLKNHPPDFDHMIILKEKQELIMMKRSININKTSSFFNGYFIKNLKEENNLYYTKELKFKNALDSKQQLLSQLGNRQLLHIFISEFNRELNNQNIAHPIMEIPPILCLKGENQYYYCEQMMQNLNKNLDIRQINLYLSALSYFSYCYSKGAYMITYLLQNGNYLYDAIISSKYGILSSCDQGQDKISKLARGLNPNSFNYSQYQQLMLKIQI